MISVSIYVLVIIILKHEEWKTEIAAVDYARREK